jgi:hypothetical protein
VWLEQVEAVTLTSNTVSRAPLLEVEVEVEVQSVGTFQYSEHTKQSSQKPQSQTHKPNPKAHYCTMMNLSLFLVFAALFNAATGNVIEESTPTTASTPPGLRPSAQPSTQPSAQPSTQPSAQPSTPPAAQPNTPPGIPPVELASASNYAILAKTGISTVPNSNIYGDVAVSPLAGAAMTGFSMVMDPSGQWSTSPQINGKAYAANYAAPISSELTAAVIDMENAYNDAAGRPNGDGARTNLGAGDITGEILTPGVYTFNVPIHFEADIAFEGDENDVFIMQTTSSLLQAAGTKVRLLGGVQAKNIFWQVATSVTVGAGAQMQGVLLAKTHVVFMTGSNLNGRVLTQTACNLQMATITEA